MGRTINRRDFIAIVAGVAAPWSRPVAAQQRGKVWRIGFLAPDRPPATLLDAFRRSLREAGHVEGRNIEIDYWFAAGSLDELPRLAEAMADGRVDLIIARSTPAALAAKQATATIPIVFVEVGDPVQAGLVANLARPDGNVTGVSSLAPDLSGKRVELLREMVPNAKRAAVLLNPRNPTTAPKLRATEAAARALKMELSPNYVRSANEIEPAFSAIHAAQADALIVLLDTVVLGSRDQIVALATRWRLPAIYEIGEFVEAGGLLSYGTNFVERFALAGIYADRIIKGAKPADLPVEQPSKFELLVNLKAGKAIGLDVPPLLLARADKVIE